MRTELEVAGWSAVVCHDELPTDGTALPSDIVVGPGGASLTLLHLTPRKRVDSVWDLGCGSGVQAVFAAQHANRVVATDVDEHALALTRESAAATGVEVETRLGSLFEPVAGERFDLVVANPPFVIGNVTDLIHRESPFESDGLTRELLRGIADHLTANGTALFLTSWLETAEEDWQERLADWLPAGLSALVLLRERLPIDLYIDVWLRDAGLADRPDLAEQWRERLRGWNAESVCFGAIYLTAGGATATRFDDITSAPRWPTPDELQERLATAELADSLTAVEVLKEPFEACSTQQWRGDLALEPWLLQLRDELDGATSVAVVLTRLSSLWQVDEDDLTVLALVGVKSLVDHGLARRAFDKTR